MSTDIEMKDTSPPATPEPPVREFQKLILASTELQLKVDVRPEPVMEEGLSGVPPEHFAELAHRYVLPELKKASPFLYSTRQNTFRAVHTAAWHGYRKRKLLDNRPRHQTLLDIRFAGVGNLWTKAKYQEALSQRINEIRKS